MFFSWSYKTAFIQGEASVLKVDEELSKAQVNQVEQELFVPLGSAVFASWCFSQAVVLHNCYDYASTGLDNSAVYVGPK